MLSTSRAIEWGLRGTWRMASHALPRSASADSRAAEQELGEQRHWATSRSLGVARHRGGPGDVQVRPLVGLGEAREETRRGHRAGGATTEVTHVGEVALELALVVVP